jgi:hypothetical protein
MNPKQSFTFSKSFRICIMCITVLDARISNLVSKQIGSYEYLGVSEKRKIQRA